MWLLIAFIAVPVIEIGLFIQVGGFIGMWPTLLIVVLTAIAGTYLVRSQGRAVLAQVQQSLGELHDPTEPLVHGAMILFSGALLLTPGFFTDAVGFALLVPGIRSHVFRAIRARIKINSFGRPGGADPHRGTAHPHRGDDGDIIDGEYIEMPEDHISDSKGPRGRSGWTRN